MLSGIVTVVLLVLFVGCWVWAWRPSHKAGFESAARLVFDETDQDPRPAGATINKNDINGGASQ